MLGVLLVLIGDLLPVVAVPHVPHHRGRRRGAQRHPVPHAAPRAARPRAGREPHAADDRAAARHGEARGRRRRRRRERQARVPVDRRTPRRCAPTSCGSRPGGDSPRRARAGAPGERTSRVAALGTDGQPRASPGSSRATRRPSPSPSRSCTSRSAGSSHPTSSAPRPSSCSSRSIVAIVVGSIAGTPWLLFALRARRSSASARTGCARSCARCATRSRPTPDGVRITFGLLTTVTEIVPPGRVHAVEITQSILWRPAGWWAIRINRLSGRSATDANTDQFTTVLPVGTARRRRAGAAAAAARRCPRAEWPLIVRARACSGPRRTTPFTNTPRRAWLIRPLSWRRNGFRLADDVLLLRRGVDLAQARGPAARAAAELRASHQGPVDRMLRVAIGRAHTSSRAACTAQLAAIDRDARARPVRGRRARRRARRPRAIARHRWASGCRGRRPSDSDAPRRRAVSPRSRSCRELAASADRPTSDGAA